MNEPRALVEHFFRHEFGRLIAVLTRSLGVRRLELWKEQSDPVDPCKLFAKNGCQDARIRLWVGEDGINRLGVDIDTFEIGNEIDFGICGEFEQEWPRRVILEFMRTQVWPRMVPILKAAQSGVLKSQPKAKFILHLAQWNNVDYCIAFWHAMLAAEVHFDYPGLSYFPSSAKEPRSARLVFFARKSARSSRHCTSRS